MELSRDEPEKLKKLLSEGLSYSEIGRGSGRHPKTIARWASELGLRSIPNHRLLSDIELSRSQLERYLEAGLSSHKIAEKVGRSQNFVYRRMKKWGLQSSCQPGPIAERPRIKGCRLCEKKLVGKQRKYCSLGHQRIWQYLDFIYRWKSGLESGVTVPDSWNVGIAVPIRRFIFEKYQDRCARCGWSERNPFSGRLALTIDHIDGNARNNKEDNLILLCYNCHALTETFGGLNAGNGRRFQLKKSKKEKE